ncbi:hypothetical protein OROMI_029814 [Orobanche minor]
MQTSITRDRDFELFRNLPRDIAINVFSRLTIESIMVCKVVCKEWRELIKSQEFGNYQPQRYRRLIVFRNTDVFPSSEHKQIYSASYEIKESNNNPLPIIHMGLSDSVPLVRSSVNGLILLLSRQWTEQQQHLLLRVCNPITCEYVKIPNPCEKEFRLGLPYPPVYRRYSFPVNTCSVEPGAPPLDEK